MSYRHNNFVRGITGINKIQPRLFLLHYSWTLNLLLMYSLLDFGTQKYLEKINEITKNTNLKMSVSIKNIFKKTFTLKTINSLNFITKKKSVIFHRKSA